MTDRRSDARHPIEVAAMAILALVAVSQIVLGPEGSRVVLAMPDWSQRTFAGALLTGAALVLLSMLITGKVGRRFELAGLFLCATALGVYAMTIADITASPLTNPAFAFGGVAVGCAARAGQLARGGL